MAFKHLTSRLATAFRMGAGLEINPKLGPRPEQPLILYEFEGCPFCRKVREAITDLDLATEVRPCPKGGERFRPDVRARKPNATFPFLVDPNTGTELFESADIVRYLYDGYGDGQPPSSLTSAGFLLSSQAASFARGVRGAMVRASAEPARPLTLIGFEGDPSARLVRELLCELELPYVRRNGEPVELSDPQHGESLVGPDAILSYLDEVWAA